MRSKIQGLGSIKKVVIIFSIALFSNGSIGSSNDKIMITMNSNDLLPGLQREFPSLVTDAWFFVIPAKNKQKGMEHMTNRYRVYSNEEFGIGLHFVPQKTNLRVQYKLVVPSSPENFSCSKCKPGELRILEDGHTIIVDQQFDKSNGLAGFYWGIDESDPRGQYQMSLLVDGIDFVSYDFWVE